MDVDPGIIHFDHCTCRVYCMTLPEKCPLCSAQITSNIVPVRMPYPFVRACQHQCAVVVRPTDGTFLSDYSLTDDLHVGVTSSRGILFEFDERGVTQGTPSSSWDQSLLVYQLGELEESRSWDQSLTSIASDDRWTKEKYDETRFNCFDFALKFLLSLHSKILRLDAWKKDTFIENYVSRPMVEAVKYVKLYREIRKRGFFVNIN